MRAFYQKLYDIISRSDKICYRHFDEEHTYVELFSAAKKINTVLNQHKNHVIAHYTGKAFGSYAAIYATLLAENTWVPLTPDNPASRNLEIIKQALPKLIIADRELPTLLEDFVKSHRIPVVSLQNLVAGCESKEFTLGEFNKDNIAYIMFTSGSTGTPKGVPMTHENYINFVENMMTILPFKNGDVFSDFHDFAFDISIFYLFCTILTQGCLSPIIKPEDKIIPLNHIKQNKITVWSSVPSVIQRIKTLKSQGVVETPVRVMFLCGEPFRLDILKYCLKNMRLDNVYNFYGLTETGVENFHHRCDKVDLERFAPQGFVPIGKPLPGNNVRVDQDGELLVNGCQVTPGYLGGIGTEKFEIKDNQVWYHTGDIVQVVDGFYFCKGRKDNQVKLSGFRVELMDIEAQLRKIRGIQEAVCFVGEAQGSPRLMAALQTTSALNSTEISSQLTTLLPIHMVPKQFVFLDSIPLNANGKIDRGQTKLLALGQ